MGCPLYCRFLGYKTCALHIFSGAYMLQKIDGPKSSSRAFMALCIAVDNPCMKIALGMSVLITVISVLGGVVLKLTCNLCF